MTALNAFVSHSFLEVDETIVRKFVELLDQVAANNHAFSWDRAIRSEPRSISEKVEDVIEDKNVFIAICSKRERVCADADAKQWPVVGTCIPPSRLGWKTSDWIIQEIGIARGRNCTTILLVEDGVRNPAPILADHEYIPFTRDRPEASFTKLLAMIGSLTPRPGSPSAAEVLPVASRAPEVISKEVDENEYEPQSHWKLDDWRNALARAISKGDSPEAEQRIYEAFLKSPLGESHEERIVWEAGREYLRIAFHKSDSMRKLLECASKSPDNPTIQRFVARALLRYDQFSDAAQAFEKAAEHASDKTKEIEMLCEAAKAYHKAGEVKKADAAIDHARGIAASDPNLERTFLAALRGVAEEIKDNAVLLGVLERLVEVDPSDPILRFTLAYQYGEQGHDNLALYHYTRIPYGQRGSGTWNNLANARAQLELDTLSVAAYNESVKEKDSLGMANLARKYLNAGFLTEAEKLCQDAIAIPDSDPAVVDVLGLTKSVPKDEAQKEDEIVNDARPYSEFLRRFGRASALELSDRFPERWRGKECILTVSIKGSEFLAVGEYEEPMSGLVNALLGSNQGPPMATPYRIEYRGRIRGCAIEGKKTRQDLRPNLSIMNSIPTTTNVLLYISADGQKVSVLESRKDKFTSLYDWNVA